MKELIRTDYIIHRKSIRQIARERHVARKTIRAALRDPGPSTYTRKKPAPAPMLDPVRPVIQAILEADATAPPKQRHTSKRIWERLRDEHDFKGAESSVRRLVGQLRAKLPKLFVPLAFDPGVDAQVDWGDVTVILGGKATVVQMFCLKLRASGAFFVRVYPTQRQECFFDAHQRAFEHLGGVPRRITYDNLKTAVKRVLVGNKREEQEAFVVFRSHHLFDSHYCTPGVEGAHEKGGVENLVGYARRNFLVPVPEVASLDELNVALEARCRSDRQRRTQGSIYSIAEALTAEQGLLQPLPAQRFACCRNVPVKADSCARVKLDTNHYSVPVEHAHKALVLRAFAGHVEVSTGSETIASHPRSYGQHQEVFDPQHYLPLLLKRPGAFGHARPMRAWKLPEVYGRYHERLVAHVPEGRGTKEYIRVLMLLRDHPADSVEVAISLALEYRAYGYDSLKSLLLHLEDPHTRARPLDLGSRGRLAVVQVGEFRPAQYERLVAGGGT